MWNVWSTLTLCLHLGHSRMSRHAIVSAPSRVCTKLLGSSSRSNNWWCAQWEHRCHSDHVSISIHKPPMQHELTCNSGLANWLRGLNTNQKHIASCLSCGALGRYLARPLVVTSPSQCSPSLASSVQPASSPSFHICFQTSYVRSSCSFQS